MKKMRVVEIAGNLMIKNDAIAGRLRERFAASATLVVNLLSSPGSGKTTLLQETLCRLAPRYRTAALVGDQATDNDATRLSASGAPVRQITTGAECRLDAEMIVKALAGWEGERFDVLFVENVGNLICPAEYDLGEDLRVVLFSVTEGEDKPLKYPLAFNTSHVVLITKSDIARAVGYDRSAATASIRQVNPAAQILEISVRSDTGVDAWIELLERRMREKSLAPAR
ncbi:MAG TPA: hydrogenase nickel incorporation protein HypB [Candidatus Cybelea sp.]|jgi:hydrogenase nickel incorporation protein HypB|nr:hydrogenase nickel incorporation protein HypB [Candidatus Cybelea sp.]